MTSVYFFVCSLQQALLPAWLRCGSLCNEPDKHFNPTVKGYIKDTLQFGDITGSEHDTAEAKFRMRIAMYSLCDLPLALLSQRII